MTERRTAAIELLADLVGFPTVTSTSNLELIDYAADRLAASGARLTRTYDEHRLNANLFATIGPEVDGGIVLSGHTDVVPADEATWTGSPYVAARRAGWIYGRGTADMKGFIACALAMAPRFAEADLGVPVHIALTFDEEIGCQGAPLLLEELARTGPRPAVAIIGEPTSMGVATAHKGCYEYTTVFTGLEGHASAPRAAVNAVEYAARYIERLLTIGEELTARAPDSSPFDPPETTVSIGTIAGGTARNVVAGECWLDWEFRPVRREDAVYVRREMDAFERELEGRMREVHPEASVVRITEGEVDGLDAGADSPAVELVCGLLDAPEVGVVAFGTEAGLYQEAGIPAVVCGPGEIDVAHRPDERLSIAQLDLCLQMMERLADHASAAHPGR